MAKQPARVLPKVKSWLEIVPWHLAQLVCGVLFLYLLYRAEQGLIVRLLDGGWPHSLAAIELFLADEQLFFLPGKLWRLFFPLTFLCFSFLVLGRLRWYAISVVGLIITLLLVGDRLNFQFFSALVSVNSLAALHQAWAVKSSILSEIGAGDYLLFLVFFLFGVFGFFINRAVSFSLKQSPRTFMLDKLTGFLLFFLAFHCGTNAFQVPLAETARFGTSVVKASDGKARHRYVPSYLSSSSDYAIHFGVFNYHVKDVVANIGRRVSKRELSQNEIAIVEQTLSESKRANDATSPLFGVAKGRNVILISMEAFQHFLLGLKSDEQELIPTMNHLSEQALIWDYCMDNVTRGGTSDAEFSIFTGLMPDLNKIVAMSIPLDPPLLSLPASLGSAGYHTASLHGYTPNFWNRNVNHPGLGIRDMFFKESYPDTDRLGLGVGDRDFFNRSVPILAKLEKPFFAFMITLSSHHPYNSIPKGELDLTIDLPASTARDYLMACSYADKSLGQFVTGMKKEGLWEESLILIYGDHTAPMDEENKLLIKDRLGVDPTSTRERRVPLFVLIPGKEDVLEPYRARYRSVVGGLHDVYPTILHLLGIEVPYGVYGTHLLNDGERPSVPYYKRANSFIKSGALYEPGSASAIKDEEGSLFLHGVEQPDPNQVQAWYSEASRAIVSHQLMFDQNAQDLAIRRHEQAAPNREQPEQTAPNGDQPAQDPPEQGPPEQDQSND